MPAAQRHWTAHQVRQLIAESPPQTPRYELVDGQLLVTPSPNFAHQRAVLLLVLALHEYLERNPIGQAYTSPFDVELEPNTIVQPDVFVLPMREVERVRREMPARELLVAAEVLSPSSSRDRRHETASLRPARARVLDYRSRRANLRALASECRAAGGHH